MQSFSAIYLVSAWRWGKGLFSSQPSSILISQAKVKQYWNEIINVPKWRRTRYEQSLDAFRFVVLARDVEGSVAIVVTHVQSGTIWSALGTQSLQLFMEKEWKYE